MEKPIKFRSLSITEQQREKTITIKDDKFTIRLPLPLDKVRLITQIARATGGLDINSIPAAEYDYIRIIVTLNFVIVSFPDWWDGADKCMDTDLLNELYNFYIESEEEFLKNLKKNSNTKDLGT
jgi:hypothetical protein